MAKLRPHEGEESDDYIELPETSGFVIEVENNTLSEVSIIEFINMNKYLINMVKAKRKLAELREAGAYSKDGIIKIDISHLKEIFPPLDRESFGKLAPLVRELFVGSSEHLGRHRKTMHKKVSDIVGDDTLRLNEEEIEAHDDRERPETGAARDEGTETAVDPWDPPPLTTPPAATPPRTRVPRSSRASSAPAEGDDEEAPKPRRREAGAPRRASRREESTEDDEVFERTESRSERPRTREIPETTGEDDEQENFFLRIIGSKKERKEKFEAAEKRTISFIKGPNTLSPATGVAVGTVAGALIPSTAEALTKVVALAAPDTAAYLAKAGFGITKLLEVTSTHWLSLGAPLSIAAGAGSYWFCRKKLNMNHEAALKWGVGIGAASSVVTGSWAMSALAAGVFYGYKFGSNALFGPKTKK